MTEHSLRYPGWRVAIAASACVLVGFASLLVYTFGVFLKPLAAEFGWSREAISAAFGLAALAVAACSPPLGWMLDRFPARRIILPCVAIFGSAFAFLSLLTPHLWRLYAVFIVLGMVGNGTAHLAYSRPLSSWFQARRGLAFALLLSGGALGAIILPPAAEALIAAAGWRRAFAVLGGISLAVGLPLAWQVRERPGTAPAAKRLLPGAPAGEGLRSRIFWTILAVLFANSLNQNGVITHLAALLTDRGIPPARAALAMSAMGGAVLGGRMLTGWLLDRYFAPRVSAALMAVAALGTFLLASAQSLAMGALAAALIGVGMGAEADVTPYLLTRYFGLRAFSTLYGFSWTAYAIAGAIGPVVMGKAFDATGSYGTFLSALALGMLVAAALMLSLPRYEVIAGAEQVPAAAAP